MSGAICQWTVVSVTKNISNSVFWSSSKHISQLSHQKVTENILI